MRAVVGGKIGRYTLEGLLGRGGMAEVFRAIDDVDGSRHALKILHVREAALGARLLREGRAQARLRHPNVLAVTDIIEAFGAPAVVMELIEGPDLQALLDERSLTSAQVDQLARGILAGVAAAHAAGLIHRDLKPSNVMLQLTPDGPVAKVADFGLVKTVDETDSQPGMTRTGSMMGTPGYMAPEQLQDAKRADARADVFSLGALIYALATGAPPFEQRNLGPLLAATTGGHHVPLSQRAPALGPERLAVVARALQGDPERRFPDAGAMLAAWQAAPALAPSWEGLTGVAATIDRGAQSTLLSWFDDDAPAPEGASTWEEPRAILWVRLGGAAESALAACEAAVRSAVTAAGGVEISGGEVFLLLFREGEDALAGARGIRAALAALPGAPEPCFGLHAGTARLRENSPEQVARGALRLEASGADVALAGRVLAAAPPGRLLTTRATAEALGAPSVDRGWWSLEGQEAPQALVEIVDAPAPPPEDTPSAQRILHTGDGWLRVAAIPDNLPPAQGAFIGRVAEVCAVAEALGDGAVALLGGPGVGKSRAARELGDAWRGDYPGGIVWVSLAGVGDADGLRAAAAAALGGEVGAALAERGRALLILDGFDALVGAGEAAVEAWQAAAPEVRVLITSRVRPALGRPVRLGPMQPEHAAALFAERARVRKPDFALTDANRADVAALVEALGHAPLAIELAAERARVMPPTKLLARLSQRFRLLAGPRGGVSLEAALAPSWARLSGEQRAALGRIARLPQPFVGADIDADAQSAVPTLVDHSLILPLEDGRFMLDPSVRDQALRAG